MRVSCAAPSSPEFPPPPWLFDAAVPLLYVWQGVTDADDGHADAILQLTDRLYQLGRGLDMVWAWGEMLDPADVDGLLASHPGPIYRPSERTGGVRLPSPRPGSLASTERRHEAYRRRFEAERKGRKVEVTFRQPVPAEALREVILNAVMHRDYSRASSYVAIAVFDDRIEVRSIGDFPTGIWAEMLSEDHPSILRNPLIAGAFHRTGAVEVWGRGTNRVIEECRRWGVQPPSFEVVTGALRVTFPAAIGPGGGARHQVGTKSALSGHQVQVMEASRDPQAIADLMRLCERSDRTKFRDQVVRPLLEGGLLEMTIPDKPRSRLQRYRTTAAGEKILREKS